MSPAMQVRTLKIDDQEVGAREDETILEVARENSIYIPTLCHLDGLLGRRRLPPVPGGNQGRRNRLLPACVTRVAEGMEVITNSETPGQVPPKHDPGTALHRAQPHLLGVRVERPLRTAEPGADAAG